MIRARYAVGLTPLVPLVTGVAIMIAAGAPRSRWGSQLVAGTLGVVAYFAARAVPRPKSAHPVTTAVLLMLGILAATLAGGGMEGVRRWIRLGPLLLHSSALFAPLLLVLAGRHVDVRPRSTIAALALAQAVHVAQPDAGQATAFGAATLVLLLGKRSQIGARTAALAAVLAAASIALAWTRPDPLAPAPFVEDIVQRAFGLGPAHGIVALASLVPLVLAPLLARNTGAIVSPISPSVSERAVLMTYLTCSLAVVLAGEFPVPLLGFGASPVVGTFLGLGALQRNEGMDLANRPP